MKYEVIVEVTNGDTLYTLKCEGRIIVRTNSHVELLYELSKQLAPNRH